MGSQANPLLDHLWEELNTKDQEIQSKTKTPEQKRADLIGALGQQPQVGPTIANAAIPARNATGGSYNTQLNPAQEQAFQGWVQSNKVPWQDTQNSDYDMRGYYQGLQQGGQGQTLDPNDSKMHFPDTYKTPYHKTFSNESKYATPDAPHWVGDQLVDKSGKVVFDDKGQPSSQPPIIPPSGGQTLPTQYPEIQDTQAKRAAAIAAQYHPINDPQYAPSKTRRILSDVGGTLAGILSRNFDTGEMVAEHISHPGYYKNLRDIHAQQEALKQPLEAEEKGNIARTGGFRAQTTAAQGQERIDETARRDAAREQLNQAGLTEKIWEHHDGDSPLMRGVQQRGQKLQQDFELATTRQEADRIKTKMLQLQHELDRASREKMGYAAIKGRQTDAEIMAGSRNEPTDTDVDAGDSIISKLETETDPRVRNELTEKLSPKVRQYLERVSPESLVTHKLSATDEPKFIATNNTLDLIPKVEEIVKTHPELIGPALGHAMGVKDWIGVNTEQGGELVSWITTLLANDASMFGGGRITKQILDLLRKGDIPSTNQAVEQFTGRIKALRGYAKINYKNLSGYEYKGDSSNPLGKYTIDPSKIRSVP